MSEKEVLEILGVKVLLGDSTTVFFNVAKLHTQNKIDVPVIIERSKIPGPTVLVTAGIHGDEINGVEIVRQLIAKGINKPSLVTLILLLLLSVSYNNIMIFSDFLMNVGYRQTSSAKLEKLP